ncbi:MAG: GCN5-related N-acetyltransferase, partial [uncultured Thermomicrobiales bacterium]
GRGADPQRRRREGRARAEAARPDPDLHPLDQRPRHPALARGAAAAADRGAPDRLVRGRGRERRPALRHLRAGHHAPGRRLRLARHRPSEPGGDDGDADRRAGGTGQGLRHRGDPPPARPRLHRPRPALRLADRLRLQPGRAAVLRQGRVPRSRPPPPVPSDGRPPLGRGRDGHLGDRVREPGAGEGVPARRAAGRGAAERDRCRLDRV